MKPLIYNTTEYYNKTDEYYSLISEKLLLEKKIARLGQQLDIQKEQTDRICKNCGHITNQQYEQYNQNQEEPVVCFGYQLD